ncbi:MAG: Trans-aconitate 2-methyltransferase [Chlamydiae bacterium]|nr:Trans-aconitate 2-methyltransferase [Chlamydiota bacterium]
MRALRTRSGPEGSSLKDLGPLPRNLSGFFLPMKILFLFICSIGFAQDHAETTFTDIYEKRVWGQNAQGEGTSGYGSSVQIAAPYMKFLQDFVKKHNIQSIVDVGCGDWEFSQYLDWNGAHYTGIDVVKSVIEKDLQKFASPTVTFHQADVVNKDLPPADLLICKDVLQHLTNDQIMQFAKQFSKFKHCLITNDIEGAYAMTVKNGDIAQGQYRCIDLTLDPFNIKGAKAFTYLSSWDKKQVLHIQNADH